jgi:hypothetical protein
MGPASSALPSDPTATGATRDSELPTSPTGAPKPRRADSGIERRIPTARETLATLPDFVAEDFSFEPHDTIPAPPWLEELEGPVTTPPKAP